MALEFPEVSEDCLYLNIYTPAKPSEDAKLPVSLYLQYQNFAVAFIQSGGTWNLILDFVSPHFILANCCQHIKLRDAGKLSAKTCKKY